jgi:hypothetical protein
VEHFPVALTGLAGLSGLSAIFGAGAGGAVTTLVDSFTAANGTPLGGRAMDSGIAWSAAAGSFDVQGNRAQCASLASGQAIVIADASTPNVRLALSVTMPPGGTTPGGIVTRYTDANNYWLWRIVPGTAGTDLQLVKVVAGAQTILASADVDWTPGATYALEVLQVGNSLHKMTVDGYEQIAYLTADGHNSTATMVGMFDAGAANLAWDNLNCYADNDAVDRLPIGYGLEHLTHYPGATDWSVAVLGDSWIGQKHITEPLMVLLQTAYGNGGAGYCSANDNYAAPTGVLRARVGTWVDVDADTIAAGNNGVDLFNTGSVTPGDYLTFTATATQFVLHYRRKTGGGTLAVSIDGGAPTSINTAGAEAYLTQAFGGLSSASHTITITVSVAGAAGCTVFGVDSQIVNGGVRLHQLGNGGTRTDHTLMQDEINWQAGLAAFDPTLVIVAFGHNEWNQNVPLATYQANLTTLVGWVRAACPSADVMLWSTGGDYNTRTLTEMDFVRACYQTAHTLSAAFVNLLQIDPPGDWSATYYTDTTHPSWEGGALLAQGIWTNALNQ